MKFDQIVIGGGVLGAFHAYEAAKRGKSVLLLERHQRPVGATVRNFGQVVPSGMELDTWFPRARKAVETYKTLQAKTDLTIRANGSTYIASDDSEMAVLEELKGLFKERGYPSTLLTVAEMQEKLPAVKASYCKGGLFFPEDVSAEPREMIHRLLAYLSKKNLVKYAPGRMVTVVDRIASGGFLLRDDKGGLWEAEKVVLCAGHEFRTLFPEKFAQSGMQVSRLQMMITKPLPQVKLPGNILTGLTIRRYDSFKHTQAYQKLKPRPEYEALQKDGVHILFKQAVDGSIIIGDSHAYAPATDVEALDYGIDLDLNERMLDEAKRIVDLPDWTIANTWNGFYATADSGIFMDWSEQDNLLIVTGIGGKGMTTSAGLAAENIERMWG